VLLACSHDYEPDDGQVEPPAPPELIQPFPDTIFNGSSALVPFDWAQISDAQIYEIQIDTISSFATDSIHQATSPPVHIMLDRYKAQAVYYARIRAGSQAWTYYTDWSEARRFYIYPEGKKE
jgi:hypothetical protein